MTVCVCVNMGRGLLKRCDGWQLHTERSQNLNLRVWDFNLPCVVLMNQDESMWPVSLSPPTVPLLHRSLSAQSSTIIHKMRLITFVLCNSNAHVLFCVTVLQLTQIPPTSTDCLQISGMDNPPTPTISTEWASPAATECILHSQEVFVFYYTQTSMLFFSGYLYIFITVFETK
jgi:hypothetical protein